MKCPGCGRDFWNMGFDWTPFDDKTCPECGYELPEEKREWFVDDYEDGARERAEQYKD